MAKKRQEKKILDVIFTKITAELVSDCSLPPSDVWEFEAEGEVHYEDNTSETLYFFRIEDIELEFPSGWQVFTKSVNEVLKSEEELDNYRIADYPYPTNRQAFASPYGEIFRRLNEIYKRTISL